jgi:hypothetical protein
MKPRHPLAALLLSAALPALAAPAMQPGLWEIATTTRMEGLPGIPAGATPPAQEMKNTQCYKAEQTTDASKMMVPPADTSRSCKSVDPKIDGNTVSWKMECGGDAPSISEGKNTFAGDSYTGEMKVTQLGGQAKGMTINMTFAGHRLGDCPAAATAVPAAAAAAATAVPAAAAPPGAAAAAAAAPPAAAAPAPAAAPPGR